MNIEEEIKSLHASITEDRQKFDDGMKNDLSFGELRQLFTQIRSKEKRLEILFAESNAICENKQ